MQGKIFAMPLSDGQYVCGRVMLDIPGNIRRRLFPSDTPLGGIFLESVLVEMYSASVPTLGYVPSPIAIPGVLTDASRIGKEWPVVAEKPVDPREVEFPESVSGWEAGAAFFCGEMCLEVPFEEEVWFKEIRVMGTTLLGDCLEDAWLSTVGRPYKYKYLRLEHIDLRYSRHRARVYEHLPFPMEMSYFDKQAMMGLHFERLYE